MNDQSKQYQQLIAKCWADEAFKQRLLANPAETLKSEGIEVPEGVRVQAVENTAEVFNLVIPGCPAQIGEEDLLYAAGGAGCPYEDCGAVGAAGTRHHLR
ncbi:MULTISPECIES: NHLP leader peptide family RiPP precursor [Thiorhodovibrio]|uniref:NHLP leader peptide family RiPP precursor n=1 Tax=Thiorhodovibrio TaxID=61593 RepID=UPI001911C495|nr:MULTISPECIES: NHLP leader peptide family RiPP precursor [Thiorhodovibrio]MBK5970280.1 NHLP leader peptide family natural product precursor [Thiorhodovibrio winogradskyi]WPL14849.1 NHLP leader peptide domain protein [Thiorhodovibrio litoralis]